MANYTGNFTYTLDFATEMQNITDTNNYATNGAVIGTSVSVYVESIISPSGTPIHENPLEGAAPDATYTYNGLPNSTVQFPIAKYDNGNYEIGNYLITYTTVIGSDTYSVQKIFGFLGYESPTISLKIEADCVTPNFKVTDETVWTQTSYTDLEPNVTSTRQITIGFPVDGIADLVGTGVSLETSTFYTTEQTVNLQRTIVYTVSGTDFFLRDVINYDYDGDDNYVVCPQELCSITNLVYTLNTKYESVRKTNTSEASLVFKDYMRAVSLLVLIREALSCGDTGALNDYSNEIKELAGDCSCGCDSTEAVLVSGLSVVDNNSVKTVYASDDQGGGFSLVFFTGATHYSFVEHNKRIDPILADVTTWIPFPEDGEDGEDGQNAQGGSTEGLDQLEAGEEYTADTDVYFASGESITFYKVEQTFTTGDPLDIEAEITANNLSILNKDQALSRVAEFVPYNSLGGAGNTRERFIFPEQTLVRRGALLYVALRQTDNSSDLEDTDTWQAVGGSGSGTGLELGSTSTTAHRGDHGVTAYNHSQSTQGNPHNVRTSEIVDFLSGVLSSILDGLPSFSNVAISASDSILSAFAKLQGQLNVKLSTALTTGRFWLGVNGVATEIEAKPIYIFSLGNIFLTESYCETNYPTAEPGQKGISNWQIAEKTSSGWTIDRIDYTIPITMPLDITNSAYYSSNTLDLTSFTAAEVILITGHDTTSTSLINSIQGLSDSRTIRLEVDSNEIIQLANTGTSSINNITTSTGATITLSGGTLRESADIRRNGDYNIAFTPLIVN